MYKLIKNTTSLYTTIRDEDIIKEAKFGDRESLDFLIAKYRHFVKMKSRNYFLIGAEADDVIQEGLVGLYKAILDYNEEKLTSFKVFAELCINRQIITAIKTNNRQKHMPLNFYISLDKPIYEDNPDSTLIEMVAERFDNDPERLYIAEEEMREIQFNMKKLLTELEHTVLRLYIEGKSYREMSNSLGKDVKAIDNALQRIRYKAQNYINIKNQI